MISLFSRNRGKKKNRLPSYLQIPNIRGNNNLYFIVLLTLDCIHGNIHRFATIFVTKPLNPKYKIDSVCYTRTFLALDDVAYPDTAPYKSYADDALDKLE